MKLIAPDYAKKTSEYLGAPSASTSKTGKFTSTDNIFIQISANTNTTKTSVFMRIKINGCLVYEISKTNSSDYLYRHTPIMLIFKEDTVEYEIAGGGYYLCKYPIRNVQI